MDLLMPPWAAALLILCAMPYLTETYDHADSVVYQNEPDVMLPLPSTAEHTSMPLVFRLDTSAKQVDKKFAKETLRRNLRKCEHWLRKLHDQKLNMFLLRQRLGKS